MKVEELRIGNWVIDPEFLGGMPVQVQGIEYDEVFFEKAGETERSFRRRQEMDKLNPIKLTEDILLKFGFEKMDDSDVLVYCKSFGKFDGEDYEDAIVITQDSQNQWYFSLGRKVIVESFHQLQNLYLALTGKEL